MISYVPLLILRLVTAGPGNCPEPLKLLSDSDSLTWTEADDTMVIEAQKGCKRHFGVDSCLISLTKRGERNYHAICSSNRVSPTPRPK